MADALINSIEHDYIWRGTSVIGFIILAGLIVGLAARGKDGFQRQNIFTAIQALFTKK
ncbi:MAG: hypothetical protein FWF59_07170 [Turicibacter sp.]|nr:hypothetical protein [Turicibacter sp.]